MEMNLYEAIKDRNTPVPEEKCKYWIYQILKSLEYMHRRGIFHRDVKPENILIRDNIVKLADLGSCKGIYSKQPFTEYVSTRWYRSPECLLTDGYYNYKMDIWGLGCVFYEILTFCPLFPGADEIDQVNKIHGILGSPSKELFMQLINKTQRTEIVYEKRKGIGLHRLMSRFNKDCVDIISKMLIYDPEQRYTAKQCLCHPYFKDLYEQDMINMQKQSSINFRKNQLGLLNNTLKLGTNDSISFINVKEDDSINMHTLRKENVNKNTILPDINIFKSNNVLNAKILNEETKREKDNYVYRIPIEMALPKIGKKISWKDNIGSYGKYLNSNGFKNSMKMKNNIVIQSIDVVTDNKGGSTQYNNNNNNNNVNIRGKIVKKKVFHKTKHNYVSPYSKRIIESQIQL